MVCRGRSLTRAAGNVLLPIALSAKQFVDARLHLVGAIDVKSEVGDAASAQALQQRVPDVPARSHESFEGLRLFLRAAVDGDVNEPGFAAGIQDNLSDVCKADARIGKLALDHRADLFTEGFGNPVSMVFTCPWLRHLLSFG